jgi:putative acetyltransferase
MHLSTFDPTQAEEIKNLFTAVFTASEGQSEGILIGNLAHDLIMNTDRKDLYGFVATENGNIIGCIFFSRLTFESGVNAFVLSPVAIHSDHQGKGIGQQLIQFGLGKLKDEGVELVMTYGDIKFYSKVGFKSISEDVIKAPLKLTYPEGWIGQSLVGDTVAPIAGRSSCVEALNKTEYW